MLRRPPRHSVLFAVVVLLCTAQLTWWVVFQLNEAARLQQAGTMLRDGEIERAIDVLGGDPGGDLAETARRRRTMFAWEGATLGVLVIFGIALFYATVLRDQRRREAQDRFLAGATHELQTPLATIRLGLESLLVGSLPSENRIRYLQGMLREVTRLESGVRNILTAAGLQSARFEPVPADLADDVSAALEAQSPRAETAGVALRLIASESCVVQRDGNAMRLVLHNLIDNAIKFSPGGGEVRVSLARNGERARITVEDDGVGIRPEDLDSIFERFTRGSVETTTHIGGSGLGLYLVRQIVLAHGGSVRAFSDGPDRGARFVVELPARRTEEKAA
jgi:signal transduction histidine kinase